MEILKIIEHALMITSFVFIMMLLIEYINVQTRGSWQESLKKSRWGQYILSAFLGSVPGCLGAFTVVSLYSHRVVSFGALVTTMIATSGDESFVMFSMFPREAIGLTVILFFVGIAAGYLTDLFYKKQDLLLMAEDHHLLIHKTDVCHCFPKGEIWQQIKNSTLPRTLLIGIFSLFLFFMVSGSIGPAVWNWKKISFTGGAVFGLFVVITVPDHFLEQHLWLHVMKKHVPKIFIWTFAALLVIHYMESYIDVKEWIQENYFQVLIVAILVGIIPESGPHLVFVTLFAAGSLPFSILLASSIVQDGHGMLPMLAVSRKGFMLVKAINISAGLIVGLISQSIL
ncbi:MAG: putative manganese transporter [Calditrichaceae bacterium]